MSEEFFRMEADQGLVTMALCRPDRANSIHIPFAAAFHRQMADFAADESVRAVVIKGEGKIWCAGGDLGYFASSGDALPEALRELIKEFHAGLHVMATMNAPVIAAVDGAASGAGFSLLAAADMAYATEQSRFSMAYTAAGLTPDGGATYFLPRLVGWRRARELMLTNRSLSALEAADWGLLNDCVADAQALEETVATVAGRLAQGPTQAFGRVKRLLEQSTGRDRSEQLESESDNICAVGGGADGREGISAFLEKRKPVFSGRP